jgi:nucleotide-binding universal stress UspA family protein
MFKHILLPLDGSKLAEATLPVAATLAKTFKAQVTLLHVIEQDAPSEIHRDRHLTNSESAFPASIHVDWHVHTAAVVDVARSISEHASQEFQPNLIIICTHGNSGIHDLIFGNIAQQVSAGSEIPVLLIRPTASFPEQIKRILLPLDNESIHDKAIPFAEDLARACLAQLDLLCVIPTLATLPGEQAASGNLMPATTIAYLDMNEEIAIEHFQSLLDEFKKAGISATANVLRGDPAATIIQAARQMNTDVIIFGTHGTVGFDAFWKRSIPAAVARRTNIPLLLFPVR